MWHVRPGHCPFQLARQRLTWLRAGVCAHSTQQHWPFPAEKTETGYAYVLTHPGTPCIFYDDLWSHGDKLRELIALRKRADITARSNVDIRCADADMYLACIDQKRAPLFHVARPCRGSWPWAAHVCASAHVCSAQWRESAFICMPGLFAPRCPQGFPLQYSLGKLYRRNPVPSQSPVGLPCCNA